MKMFRAVSFTSLLALWLATSPLAPSQERPTGTGSAVQAGGIVEMDKMIHDFGDFLKSDGPKSCVFTVRNISDSPVAILTVTSSCGCTGVEWTKAPLRPGEEGSIRATYSNDQGAYPFEKTLTAYISGLEKPLVLRIRGNVLEKKKPLAELFPIHLGALALKDTTFKLGNLSQGSRRSDFAMAANIGKSRLNLSFKDVSEGLDIRFEPENPAPGKQTRIVYTVTTSRKRWGRNWYEATPVVDGKARKPIRIWAFTKEDFSSLSKAEKSRSALPYLSQSTFEFGIVSPGTIIDAGFSLKNKGKSELRIYKIDSDTPGLIAVSLGGKDISGVLSGSCEATLEAGSEARLALRFDTSYIPKGEGEAVIATLTTNSPLRPIVNIFLSGAVK